MTEKIFPASDEALRDAIGFVEEELEKVDCPMKTMMQISVCVEEMFVNIAHYAYRGAETENSIVSMSVDTEGGTATIVLKDHGIPFDPLAKPDPDITLSADERQIGGLGIFMVKKSMDEVGYERTDETNIFTMRKEIG